MSDAIEINCLGLPAAQGSKRHVGHGVMVEMSQRLPAWRNDVRHEGAEAMAGLPPWQGPLALRATFVFPRPKHHYRTGRFADELKPTAPGWKPSAPDLDKLVRALCDALTGVVWLDDAQVVDLSVTKIFGQNPGVSLSIHRLA